VEFNCTNTI